MSIFSDILSAITTRGRRIQIKMGLAKDFNDSKLKVGEFGLILDEDELRIGLADGSTKEVGTKLNNTLTSTSTTEGLTAAKGKELKDLIDAIGTGSGGGSVSDIPIASITQDGLMPKSMVVKLNGIANGANFVQVVDSVASTSTVQAASANAVKQAYDLANTAKTLAENSTSISGGDVKSDGSVALSNVTIGRRKTNTEVGTYSYAQGADITASNLGSHAEGWKTTSSGMYSHAEGNGTVASGEYSHAEGLQSSATAQSAHAEGNGTLARGLASHAEGGNTEARYSYSHAGGIGTITPNYATQSQGCYNKPMEQNGSYVVTNTAYIIGNGTSDANRSNAFRVVFDGSTYGQGAFNSTGADYAEYFEWQDLNPDNEDRVGYFVALNGEKIEIANSNSDYIIGVISANPSIIGDSYQDQWQGMYVTDEWGRIQNEYIDVEYEEINEEGNTITKTRQDYVHKLNPNYDTNSEYTPREQRKEWSAVGMLGKLLVRDDGTCEVNGYAKVSDGGIATKSDSGYRVIKRVDENIVQIIFK